MTLAVPQRLAAKQNPHVAAKLLADVPQNQRVAAKPLRAVVQQNPLAAAKLPLVVVPLNPHVAAKPLRADVQQSLLVAVKPHVDALLNQLAAAKFLPADAARNVAVCSPDCSLSTRRALAANQLAVAK